MKKLLITLLALGSFSLFAQSVNWDKIAEDYVSVFEEVSARQNIVRY